MLSVKRKDLLIFLLLLFTVFGYFLYSYKNYDRLPNDDDVYLMTALNYSIPFKEFGNLLYPGLMYIFSLFNSNKIDLIYNYYFFTSSLLFVSFYFYLRFSRISIAISYLLSTAFLFSSFQISLSPRLTILNLIIGFVFLSIITTKQERYIKWGFMTVCLLLCNYVSVPEFFIFFLISFVIFLYKTTRSTQLSLIEKIKPIGFVIGIIAILFFLGGGIQNHSVFIHEYKYHFLDNWELWTGEHYDFQDELFVFERVYGKANSLFEFIYVNPKLFLKHIFYNLAKYFVTVLGIFKSCFYQPFVSFFGNFTKYVFGLLILFAVFTIDIKASYKAIKNQLKYHKVNLDFLEIFSLPGFVIAILVYPRNHFTILDLPIYFLIVGLLLNSIELKAQKAWKWTTWILVLGYFVGVYLQKPKFNPTGHIAWYMDISSASLKKPLSVLSNDSFGYSYYSSNSTSQYRYDANNDDLVKLLGSHKYDILSMFPLDLEIPANREFIANNYLKTDYVRIRKFENIQRYIFAKKDLATLFLK